MKSIYQVIMASAMLALLGLTSGCYQGQTATEEDFGNSVRHMIRAQTLNPNPVYSDEESRTVPGDGERLDNVMDAYRNDVSKPEDVKKDIVISVGN